MKKFLLSFLTILFFTACQKQISTDKVQEEIVSAANKPSSKIIVCHHDALTGKNKSMLINATAWPEHQAHGDLMGDCPAVITTICGKDWMIKNLDVSKYRNGEDIPQVTDATEWYNLTSGALCYYNNDPANGLIYGKLYNWYAVNDSRGLTPAGWHVPSDAEWTTLENCLDAISPTGNVGGKLKETGIIHWASPNTGATNSSGFTGLSGGARFYTAFFNIGLVGDWWSSTENSINASYLNLLFISGSADRGLDGKQCGLSVRCVRD